MYLQPAGRGYLWQADTTARQSATEQARRGMCNHHNSINNTDVDNVRRYFNHFIFYGYIDVLVVKKIEVDLFVSINNGFNLASEIKSILYIIDMTAFTWSPVSGDVSDERPGKHTIVM